MLISLFDTKGKRLESMNVLGRVGEVGLSAVQKLLEPMQIAGTVTYGNVVSMPKPGLYSIELDWHVKGENKWSRAVFVTGTQRSSFRLPEHWENKHGTRTRQQES